MSEDAESSLAQIAAAIDRAETIVLLAHARPDGDAIGSQLALGASLRERGKTVIIMNEDGCPSNLDFLPESEIVVRPGDERVEADLGIALDTATRVRLGANCLAATEAVSRWINIDHHVSNERYGDLVYVDPDAPATGQLVYELITGAGWPLTPAARDNIFVAISTDTGGFRYPATNARSYEIGAELLRAGADCGALSSAAYERYPYRRLELLRELLGKLRMTAGGRCASWALDLETKERLGLASEDSEGITDLVRAVDTVVVAVFFEELHDGLVRVSMRSKDREVADVCEICSHFGGGGHPLAAGARIEGDLEPVIDAVHEKIHQTLS